MMIALLEEKIEAYKAQLAWLDELRQRELAKPIPQHDARVLRLLYRESCVYRFALAEVTAIHSQAGRLP